MKLRRYNFRGGDPGKGKGDSSTGFPTHADEVTDDESPANLISSEVTSLGAPFGHVLAIDIDLPCHLIETSPGRHHLIVEKRLSWPTLERLLMALAEAHIIEEGFAAASIKRQKTFLRIHPTTPLEMKT